MRYADLHQDLVLYCGEHTPPIQTEPTTMASYVSLLIGSTFTPPKPTRSEELAEVIRQLRRYHALTETYSGIVLVTNAARLRRLKEQDTGVLLHIEGVRYIDAEPESRLDRWRWGGVRSIGLIWNEDTCIGASATGAKQSYGLTAFGKRVVRAADARGIVIDCAHASEQSARDVLAMTNRPPYISHTGARAVHDTPRNTSDQLAREIAARGGIVGVFLSPRFLSGSESVTVTDVADHIEHLVSVIGDEHVAIGSDFGGISGEPPQGMESVHRLPLITEELRQRSFTQDQIARICTENAYHYILNALSA